MSRAVGTASLMGARFLGMGLQFLAVPLYLRWIGPAGYGTYALSGILGMYIMVSDPGFSEATVTQVSKLRALGNEEDAWATQRSHLGVVLYLSLLVAVTSLLVGFVLSIKDMPLSRGGIVAMCLLVGLQGIGFLLGTVFTAVLQVLGKFTELSYVAVTTSLCSVLASVALGYTTRSPLGVIAGQTIGNLLMAVFAWWLASKFSGRNLLRPKVRRSLLSPLLALCARELPNRIVSLLAGTGDKAIIAGLLGVKVGGQYTYSARLPEALNDALQPICSTALPEMSRRHALGEKEFAAGVVRTTMLSLAVGVSFILVPAGFALPFLELWLGKFMPEFGPAVLLGIACYRTVQIYGQTYSMAFFAAGKPQISLPFNVFNAAVTVFVTAIALRYYGVMGAVYMNMAIAAAMFLAYAPAARLTAAKELAVGPQLGRSLASVGIGALFTWAGYWLCHDTPLVRHPVLALATAPVAAVACMTVLIGLKLCPVPEPIHLRLSALKRRMFRRAPLPPEGPADPRAPAESEPSAPVGSTLDE